MCVCVCVFIVIVKDGDKNRISMLAFACLWPFAIYGNSFALVFFRVCVWIYTDFSIISLTIPFPLTEIYSTSAYYAFSNCLLSQSTPTTTARGRKSFCLPFNFLISFVWSNIKLIFDPTHFPFTREKKWCRKVVCATCNLFRGGKQPRGRGRCYVEKTGAMVKWQHRTAWYFVPFLFICLFFRNKFAVFRLRRVLNWGRQQKKEKQTLNN